MPFCFAAKSDKATQNRFQGCLWEKSCSLFREALSGGHLLVLIGCYQRAGLENVVFAQQAKALYGVQDFVRESTSVFKICKFRRNNRALNMQCAIYANSKSPHCCVVNCGQDDKKMTARSQKWGLLPVMFAEPLFQVSGHKISQKYYI